MFEEVSLALAFLAGLLSFLSPCVLPILPVYIAFLTGSQQETGRLRILSAALLFVLGFTGVFMVFGASASLLGQFFLRYQILLRRVAGLMIIGFGLHLSGFLRLPWLDMEKRVQMRPREGLASAFFMGLAFGAGWSPCIGPILGSILIYASSQATLGYGLLLLGGYSAGLALPFLLAALFVSKVRPVTGMLRQSMGWLPRVAGLLLLAAGLMVFFDLFTRLALIFPPLFGL